MAESGGLSADQWVELILGALAFVCIVPGVGLARKPGRRALGWLLIGLGVFLAFALYSFATFTIRLF